MSSIETEKRFFKLHEGRPHFAIVTIQVVLGTDQPEGIIDCSGNEWVWRGQGDVDVITQIGFEDWKQAAVLGAKYALRHANCSDCSVTITKIVGRDFTDTNPSIVVVVAALAVWQALNYKPSKAEEKKLDDILFNSWNLPYDAMPEI